MWIRVYKNKYLPCFAIRLDHCFVLQFTGKLVKIIKSFILYVLVELAEILIIHLILLIEV